MSVRLYIGNLPQNFDSKELEAQLSAVGEGIRFKPVLDRETGVCRGFGFASVENSKIANSVIEQLNGKEFSGNNLRVEKSERRESGGGGRRGKANDQNSHRKGTKKLVHSDAPSKEAPDPRWAGELSKLKELLANQKTAV